MCEVLELLVRRRHRLVLRQRWLVEVPHKCVENPRAVVVAVAIVRFVYVAHMLAISEVVLAAHDRCEGARERGVTHEVARVTHES